MKTVALLVGLLLMVSASCIDDVEEKGFTLGKEYTFQMNRWYFSQDGRYGLIFTDVNDSRCPSDVVCVWSGEVSLTGTWKETGKNDQTIQLHSVVTNLQTLPEGIGVQFVSVFPESRKSSESIDPKDYRITLLISAK
jgi:hypothetical protein